MFWRDAKHTPLEQIQAILPWLSGIEKVSLTGGEPTAHPQFHEISMAVKAGLPHVKLGLETNATLYPRFKPSLALFDSIDATLYGPQAWEGCPSNAYKIALLKKDYPALRILPAKHLTFANNRGANPCGREARAHWSHGLVYGCCAAPGHKTAQGIELAPGWHEQLKTIRLPCAECVYGQP